MLYVSRNDAGIVNGCFGVAQWNGQEYLEDTHPDIVAFKTAMQAAVSSLSPMERRLTALEDWARSMGWKG